MNVAKDLSQSAWDNENYEISVLPYSYKRKEREDAGKTKKRNNYVFLVNCI